MAIFFVSCLRGFSSWASPEAVDRVSCQRLLFVNMSAARARERVNGPPSSSSSTQLLLVGRLDRCLVQLGGSKFLWHCSSSVFLKRDSCELSDSFTSQATQFSFLLLAVLI